MIERWWHEVTVAEAKIVAELELSLNTLDCESDYKKCTVI